MKRTRLFCLMAFAPISLSAQSASNPRPEAARPDTLAWRPVMDYVVKSLSGEILRASTDSVTRGWHIVLPASTPAWQAFRTHLLTSVGGREPRPGDLTLDELTIDTLRIQGDTASTSFARSHDAICADGSKGQGYGNIERIYTVKVQNTFWSVARPTNGVHGDRLGCR